MSSTIVDSLGSDKDINSLRTSFYKSEAMSQAFRDAGIEYTYRMWDSDFAEWERKTKRHEKERIQEIGQLKRVVNSAGESFIVYDMHYRGTDPLGNELTAYRSNIGCAHRPIVRKKIVVNDEGDKVPVVTGIERLETFYYLPLNKENITKIEKYITPRTAFSIQKLDGDGRKITVNSFESWKSTDKDAVTYLHRFGKYPPSDYEKTLYANELQGKYETYKPPIRPGTHIG